MYQEKEEQHEPQPMKHYPEVCYQCGKRVENPIHGEQFLGFVENDNH
jgi:hypothetical protein